MNNFKICIGNSDNSIYIEQAPDLDILTEYTPCTNSYYTSINLYIWIICKSLQLKLIHSAVEYHDDIGICTSSNLPCRDKHLGCTINIPLYLQQKIEKAKTDFHAHIEKMDSKGNIDFFRIKPIVREY